MKRGLEKCYSDNFMGDYAADERIAMREALKTATNRKTEAFDIGILFKGSYDKIHFATIAKMNKRCLNVLKTFVKPADAFEVFEEIVGDVIDANATRDLPVETKRRGMYLDLQRELDSEFEERLQEKYLEINKAIQIMCLHPKVIVKITPGSFYTERSGTPPWEVKEFWECESDFSSDNEYFVPSEEISYPPDNSAAGSVSLQYCELWDAVLSSNHTLLILKQWAKNIWGVKDVELKTSNDSGGWWSYRIDRWVCQIIFHL